MATKHHLITDFFVNYNERKFSYQVNSNADVLVILGPSGYGKSTFLDALLGVNKVSGFIKFSEMWFSSDDKINIPIEARSLGWVPQSHVLFPHLKVRENLEFGIPLKGSFSDEIDWIIEVLELGSILDKRPQTISGGETQRVAIGRALVSTLRFSNGGLLLLDEPYASLDSELVHKVSRFVFEWCSRFNINSVFSVHEMDRIGVWRTLEETTIVAYSLEKKGVEVRAEQVTLPSPQKNV